MIFVGRRGVGKTYKAIEKLVSRIKSGENVGIISFDRNHANYLKRIIENKIRTDAVYVYIITLKDIESVNHVFIDELDRVLGDKCICCSGGVIKLERADDKYNPTNDFDGYTYREELNEIFSEYDKQKCREAYSKLIELSIELDKINIEINFTPNEQNWLSHKISMLNKRNEVEIEMANIRATYKFD